MLDGMVAIVTGAGRGIGREEALVLAAEGAKVIANDVGAAISGQGANRSPAEQTVEDIRSDGGVAEVNTDDVSSWAGAENLVNQARESWGQQVHPVCQALPRRSALWLLIHSPVHAPLSGIWPPSAEPIPTMLSSGQGVEIFGS